MTDAHDAAVTAVAETVEELSRRGALLALAAAPLLLAGMTIAAGDADADDKVRCYGINECKGHGSSTCRGQGTIKVTRAVCKAKGGRIVG